MYKSVNNIYLSERQIQEQFGGTVEQWWWNGEVEQWDIDGGTVWRNNENSHGGKVWWNIWTVMVEQCRGTVEQSWWNSVVEQWNSHAGTVLWNSGTVMVQQFGGTIEQSWWNCGTLVVEQGNETVQQ